MYETSAGKCPFDQWMKGLDGSLRVTVAARIKRIQQGNLGNCKAVGGVFELKFKVGGAIRIYFAYIDGQVILLLHGGNKSRQQDDIKRAQTYWADWQRRNE